MQVGVSCDEIVSAFNSVSVGSVGVAWVDIAGATLWSMNNLVGWSLLLVAPLMEHSLQMRQRLPLTIIMWEYIFYKPYFVDVLSLSNIKHYRKFYILLLHKYEIIYSAIHRYFRLNSFIFFIGNTSHWHECLFFLHPKQLTTIKLNS